MTKQEKQKEWRDHVMMLEHDFRTCRKCLEHLKGKGIRTISTITNLNDSSKDRHESVDELLNQL